MKVCPKCTRELPFECFNKKGKGLQPWCRRCNQERSREYYAANKEKQIKQITKARRDRHGILLDKVLTYLEDHGCEVCGINDPRVLEFDHLADKEQTISMMVRQVMPWQRILTEINKCQVLCANHHRIKTATDYNWYANRTIGDLVIRENRTDEEII